MSVIRCLMQKAEAGLVSKKTAEKIAGEIGDLKNKALAGSDVGKELEAAQQAFDIITNRLEQKAKQTAIHADLIKQGAERFKKGAPVDAVLKSFSFTDEANGYRYGFLGDTAQERVNHYQRIFTSMAVDVLDQLDPKRVGAMRDPAKQLEIKKDLFALLRGQGTRSADPVIREVTDGIAKLTTAGAQAFERAGGNITQRKDFMLGRSVIADKVLRADMATYVQDSLKAFDLDLVSKATDGLIKTPDDLARALQKDYQAIVSGGIADLSEFAPKGIKSIVNSRNHHRIFHFKDAESMQAWNAKYGADSLYQNVVDYADRIGKDVGILETYGPKPEAFIRSMLKEAAITDPIAANKSKDAVYRHFRAVTGQWDRSLDPTMSKWLATYRSMNVANKLGSTVIDAAVMDAVGLNAVVKSMRGLPVLKTIYDNFKTLLTPGLNVDKKEWARLGWLNESFINEALYHLRASEAEGGHKLAANLAEGVMKYTGLTRITNTTKGVNVKHLGETLASQDLDKMPKAFKNWMAANGVDDNLIKLARQVGTETVDQWGINVISPAKMYEAGYTQEAAKIGALFNRVQEIVSPTSAPELKAWFSDFERGSAIKQFLAGSSKTFTGYVGSFYNNHLRVLAALPGYGDKAKWTAATFTSLTASGLIATWMRDIVNGKDPKFDDETLLKAISRANVLPVVGDYLLSSGSRYGTGGLMDQVGGVFMSDVSKAGKAVSSFINDKPKQGAQQTQQLLENLIPGKNAWFAGLALKRTILDQVRYLYDPEAEKYYKKKAARAEKEGQPFWWAPGQTAPTRAPNLDNITQQPFFKPDPATKGK